MMLRLRQTVLKILHAVYGFHGEIQETIRHKTESSNDQEPMNFK